MQQGGGKLSESYQEKTLLNLLNITMTDPERSKGRKKGSPEVRTKKRRYSLIIQQMNKKPPMPEFVMDVKRYSQM